MKKLFSIFCCLLLSASMVTQAQLRETVNKSPNGDILHKANLASGRNNAPTAIQGAWDYESSSAFNQTFSSCSVAKSDHYSYDNLYILSAEITDTYWLYLGFNVTLSNGKIPAGTYTVTKFSNYDYCDDDGGSNYYMWISYPANTCAKSQGIRGSGTGWRITPSYIESNSNTWCIQSGSVTIKHVNNGCGYYVTTSSLKNYNGKSVSFTIGRNDYTYTITTGSNNNSWGTVSGGGSKTEGTNVTLTANAAAGCRFVQWQDGNTDNPRTFKVTGNATYTATFSSASAGTITGVPDDANHGSVTVSPTGNQSGGTAVTLTATPLYDYQFIKWLEDGKTSNPRTVYVDGNATYTAVFGRVMQINIPNAQCNDATSQNPGWFQYVAEDDEWRVLIAIYSNTFGGSYTESDCALANCKIIDKAENETIMVSTLSATTWGINAVRYFEGDVMGDDGKKYHLFLAAPNASGAEYDNGGDVTMSFSSCSIETNTCCLYSGNLCFSDENNRTRYVHANTTSGGYNYKARLEIVNTTGSIATGVYPINYSYSASTAVPQHGYNDYYGVSTLISGCSMTKYNDAWNDIYCWMIRSGVIDVINKGNGSYYMNVRAINSNGSKLNLTIGTLDANTMQTVTATGEHGSVTLSATSYANQTGTGTYQYGTRVTLTPVPASGYEFAGWTGTDVSEIREKDGVFSVKVGVKNLNVTPVFVGNAIMHTITINPATNGTITVKDGETTINNGDQVEDGTVLTVTTTPATGYHFDSWTNDGAASVTVNSDVTIGATFAINTYTVTIAKNEDGWGTISATSVANVPYGTVITTGTGENANKVTINGTTVTATPADATARYTYSFNNWTNALATVTGDMTVTANFNRVTNTFTVTFEVNSTSAGYGLLQKDNETPTNQIIFTNVPYGTAKPTSTSGGAFTFMNSTVTPIPTEAANGYTYAAGGWSSFPTSAITSNKTAKIRFTRTAIEYTITYNNYDISTYPGTLTTIYTVETQTITLPFAPNVAKEGYTFGGWYDNEELTGTPVTSIAQGSTGNKEFWAKWEAKTYAITYNAGENGTGTIAAGEKTYNVDFILSSSTFTRTGYTQTGWSTEDGGSKAYDLGDTYTDNTALNLYPYWEVNTYDITWKSEDGASTLETDNAQAFGTTTAYNGAVPTKSATGYTYTFDGWTTEPNGTGTFYANGETPAVSGAATYYAHFTGGANTHTLSWVANGGTLTGGTAAGTTAYGTTLEAPTATREGYTFNGWSPSVPATMPDDNATYTAQWNRIEYTITYGGLNGETNTNPDTYTIESEDINLVAPGTRDGYIFAGWKDESDNTITQIAKGSTGNRTLTATWNVKSSNIELCEKCDNNHYNTFKTNYNGETVNVTYNRQFAEGRWSTMCLPFSLDLAAMITHKMSGCVYEFKYATGNANVGSGVNLYFSNAKSIEAGKCYIVNANAALAEKTSFVFSGVTIDLTKDNGADLSSPETPEASMAAYNALPGYKSEGTIELVGTLRNGILMGKAAGNTYMGLKDNKIYYPNISQGSTIWAYRGIFRSSEILDKESMQKMRIIVDGEDRGELIIDADGGILAPSDAQSRKFIENGVLYIEREGVIYDAQGKRIK